MSIRARSRRGGKSMSSKNATYFGSIFFILCGALSAIVGGAAGYTFLTRDLPLYNRQISASATVLENELKEGTRRVRSGDDYRTVNYNYIESYVEFEADGAKYNATVTLSADDYGEYSWKQTPEGEKYHFEFKGKRGYPDLLIGDKITVFYDPLNPNNGAYVRDEEENYALTGTLGFLIPVILGIVFVLAGTWILKPLVKDKALNKKLMQSGRRVETQVVRIGQDFINASGVAQPEFLVCVELKDVEAALNGEKVMEYESDVIENRASLEEFIGRRVTVYVGENNYHVDLTELLGTSKRVQKY